MRLQRTALAVSLLLGLAGCAAEGPKKEEPVVDLALAQYVLDEVPSDVKNPTFIDFEGKVALVGWDFEPEAGAGPGQAMKLKLYWKCNQKLGPGWSLFTHLVAPSGTRLDGAKNGVPFDDIGPLRARSGPNSPQALPPSAWVPGKVYVDVQELEMPMNVNTPEVSILVGVWKAQNRLDVISGPSDRERRGIVTHVRTGVTPATAAQRPPEPTRQPVIAPEPEH
ncbi:MAG: hypothetical protein U0263_22755 [Polyangiaceae bacterium]